MTMKLKPIRKQAMVITGASSGIGLATARLAASRGAKVVLAARSGDELEKLAAEIKRDGGEALPVTTDVTNLDDVRRLAKAAIAKYGRIDTWVNDAGTSIYGEIKHVPVEEERKLFEVNYWGIVYGSRVAAEHMREHGGAIINLGSIASDLPIPLQASYAASKHAVKAFTSALRVELEHEGAPVAVSLIKPTGVDTPLFRHAKTYMGAQPIAPPPMYSPSAVAEAILQAAEKPAGDVLVGGAAVGQSALGRWFPRMGEAFNKRAMFEGQKSRRAARPGENRGLYEPSGELAETGDYGTLTLQNGVKTKSHRHPVLRTVLGVGAGAALMATLRHRARSS